MPLHLISHPLCREHMPGEHHPEAPSRMGAINDALIARGVESFIRFHEAPRVTEEQLLRVHSHRYIDQLRQLLPESGTVDLDGGDTALSEGTLTAAYLAAGAAILGVDLIMNNGKDPVFCQIRPPGHHAKRDEAMGFCIFNNIAVAAAHAMEVYGLSRVAIIDFDVHHGNGTESIFKNDSRVYFFSVFQHPFYPWSDELSPYENMSFVPLAAGATGSDLEKIVSESWIPEILKQRPEMLFISAGFDGHRDDPTADLLYAEQTYF